MTVSSCGLLAFSGIASDIHCDVYFFHIFSLLEFLNIYKVSFARNELEALPLSICAGQVKAIPQQ